VKFAVRVQLSGEQEKNFAVITTQPLKKENIRIFKRLDWPTAKGLSFVLNVLNLLKKQNKKIQLI